MITIIIKMIGLKEMKVIPIIKKNKKINLINKKINKKLLEHTQTMIIIIIIKVIEALNKSKI